MQTVVNEWFDSSSDEDDDAPLDSMDSTSEDEGDAEEIIP